MLRWRNNQLNMDKQLTINYQEFNNWSELPEDERKLLEAADKARKGAHCKYSKFYVGAAALLEDSEIITGSNFENAAFGSTCCAEVVLVNKAHSEGKTKKIRKIVVLAGGPDHNTSIPVSPCGNCRQVLSELEGIVGQSIPIVISCDNQKTIKVSGVQGQLLPFSFSDESLKI